MKDEQLYEELREVAEKLDIAVVEHNFKHAGIRVKSGFCLVKNQRHCIIDKHIRIKKKIAVLAECLGTFPYDHVFMVPAVRDLLEHHSGVYIEEGNDKVKRHSSK